jgi:hypothetical protein
MGGLLGALAGCGGSSEFDGERVETVPAKGTVKVDGKPFGPGSIEFVPMAGEEGKTRPATARVADDGAFVLGTYEEEDGAIPGAYRVNIASDLSAGPAPAVEEQTVTIGESGADSLVVDLKSSSKGAGSLMTPHLETGASTSLK